MTDVLICLAIALGINWLAYIPAMLAKTERYYDLTGAFSNISIAVAAFVLGDGGTYRTIMFALVFVWAARLGVFLFRRILRDGSDKRFDKMKHDPKAFFVTWTLQGVWGFMTQLAAIIALTSDGDAAFGIVAGIGVAIWLIGFTIEAVSDQQKRAFRDDSANDGRFISTGLWAWSRHPNYFGEIVLWIGIAVMTLPQLSGWGYVGLISPLFVIGLLTKVSGIPMLEAKANRRWNDDAEYVAYRDSTPVLIPSPPRS